MAEIAADPDADLDLVAHRRYLEAELRAAQQARLSARQALLVALLIDAFADRLFAAQTQADDALTFRTALAARSAALGLVFDVAAGRARLVTEAVEVPVADYGSLSVEDFMVSLYNGHTVQRVLVAAADGRRYEAHAVLAEAVKALTPSPERRTP